ncbi:MAG: ATP-binding protein [Cyanobacteria bacterium P01_C01_bin.72]
MQHYPDCDRLANTILQIALNNTDGLAILSGLAATLGSIFAVDSCIIVSRTIDAQQVNQVGSWQDSQPLADKALQQLSALSIPPDSNSASLLVESTSPLFTALNCLLRKIAPGKSWLGMTTQVQGQNNGLVLLLKSENAEWTATEAELLTQIASSLAISISQAQLQQQSHTKSRYQNLLKNLSREISQGYQLKSLLQNCLAEIGHALQLDRSMILMFKYQNPLKAKDRGQKTVKGTAKITCQWSSHNPSLSTPGSFNLSNSDLCQQAWRNAPDCLDLDSDAAFPDLNVEAVTTRGSALLMMPLMGKKTSETDSAMVLGFLLLQKDLPHYWSQDERELIGWVGVQISTAIVNEQTLNRVQLIVDERTAQLTSSIDMQGKLSAKMRQHIEQLQKLNQLKDDFMNSMSHELKTPLTSMKIAIKMLRQPEIPPQMREKYLDILEQEWNREYNLIKDLLTLQQVESGQLDYSPQELDLAQTITSLSQSFRDKWQEERDINLVCHLEAPDLKIHTDAESLKHILQELLTNAGKYCDSHTTIELAASSQLTAQEEEIVISVANLGAGIAVEELPHIFDKFRRGQGVTDRAVPGTGLGLTLVQYLVEHLGGTISVTSKPLADDQKTFLTTFVLKLPQIQPSIG